MNGERQIVTRAGGEVVEVVEGPEAATQAKPANPILMIHGLLRGRYGLAIGLALLGAAIGGPLGFFVLKPEYRSTGVVEVRATLPAVLYQTPENQTIPNFGPFLMTQVELLRSSRVVGLAMQDPKWKALGRGLMPEQVAKFNKSLDVQSPRNSQLIYVQFTDPDPNAAKTAVEALIRAYEKVFVDMEIGAGTPLIKALEDIKARQTASVQSIRDRILGEAGKYDPAALQQIYDATLKLWLEAAEEYKRAEAAASVLAGAQAPGAPQPAVATTQPNAEVLDELVRRDPWLQQWEQQRVAADRELRAQKLKLGDSHPKVAEARETLALIEEDIAVRTEQLADYIRKSTTQPAAVPGGPAVGPLADPRANLAALKANMDSRRAEWDDIALRKRKIDDLNYELKSARDVLDATNTRITQLNVEGQKSGGRLSVLSYGDVPSEPEKDRRRALTAVGAIGGAGLGIAIVALMGFFDPRLRHVDATRTQLRPIDRLLGVLPELPDGTINSTNATAASFCVHHVRALLQIRQRATGHKLIGITSPAPGDGKTTLVISLGMSLAATGTRTLLVDCDFDGAGLSSRMRRLIDQRANGAGPGVFSATSRPSSSGLDGAIKGTPLEAVILPTGYPNLSLLPLGVEPGTTVGQLAPQTLHRLFTRLTESFDTVLVDTGPILGSVEASIVAAEVDSMILVVSRNGDRVAADQATEKLAAAGAEIEGMVFNRALESDVERSAYRTSASTRSRVNGASKEDLQARAG